MKQNGKKKKKLNDTSRLFWIFILPWLIGFGAFTCFPMIYSFAWRWSHFKFKTKQKNTFFYIGVSVPLNTVVSIFLAMLLNKRLLGTNVFRGIFYLPTICTGVATYIAWTYLFNGTNGFINVILNGLGMESINFLGNRNTAMLSIIFMDMFCIGTAMTIVLAGLQDVPRDYYEAAQLDGASGIQRFWHITFPLISPVVFFNVLMAIIKGLQIFTQPYVMTGGGPAQSTYVYGLYLYNTAFSYGKFGYASALAWVLFIIMILLTLVILGTSKFWVFYREDVN